MKLTLLLMTMLTGSIILFSACRQDQNTVPVQSGFPYQSSFQQGADGWTADLTDYSTAQEGIMEFKFQRTSLPSPLDASRQSLMLSSMNRSDDAFMFLKKKITGLQPNAEYKLVFDVELASQYSENSIGIGGSPGSSVFLKAGATATEPMKVLSQNFYSLNIDKGNQAAAGKDALILGNVGTSSATEDYALIKRSNANSPFVAKTSDQGELWLLIGTDSGYEGQTTLYYSHINVTLK